jgi:hypothetical protein
VLSLLIPLLNLLGKPLHLPLRQQTLNELANLVDVKPIPAQTELLHLLRLLVLSRKGNLQSEPVGVVVAHHQVLVESELEMGEVAEVLDVDGIPGLLLGRPGDEVVVVAEREQVDEGVDVGGGGEVEPRADGALGTHLLLVLVGPEPAVRGGVLRLPEHQVDQDLLEQRQADVLRHLDPLFVSYTVLVYHHEVSQRLCSLE